MGRSGPRCFLMLVAFAAWFCGPEHLQLGIVLCDVYRQSRSAFGLQLAHLSGLLFLLGFIVPWLPTRDISYLSS